MRSRCESARHARACGGCLGSHRRCACKASGRNRFGSARRGRGTGAPRHCDPATCETASAVLVDVTTWSLETKDPSELRAAAAPASSIEIRQAIRPTPELGRFLYTASGGNWYWFNRLSWSYDRWLERFALPRVEVWIMYCDGTPAGFFELDGSIEGDVEIAYFGLMPQFLGQKLGG